MSLLGCGRSPHFFLPPKGPNHQCHRAGGMTQSRLGVSSHLHPGSLVLHLLGQGLLPPKLPGGQAAVMMSPHRPGPIHLGTHRQCPPPRCPEPSKGRDEPDMVGGPVHSRGFGAQLLGAWRPLSQGIVGPLVSQWSTPFLSPQWRLADSPGSGHMYWGTGG